MKALVTGPDGKDVPIEGGLPTASACRASWAAIIEASHDDAGIIWPEPVAPFDIALSQSEERRRQGRCRVRRPLRKAPGGRKDVLYDDNG